MCAHVHLSANRKLPQLQLHPCMYRVLLHAYCVTFTCNHALYVNAVAPVHAGDRHKQVLLYTVFRIMSFITPSDPLILPQILP